jgi:hypothetical protein
MYLHRPVEYKIDTLHPLPFRKDSLSFLIIKRLSRGGDSPFVPGKTVPAKETAMDITSDLLCHGMMFK